MRKAFNHYANIYEIKKQLNDKQYILFDKALCGVQFLELHIESVSFKDPILTLLWTSIKHTIKSNIEGYCNKMKINYEALFDGHTNPTIKGGTQGGSQQEKEKEKGKGKGKEEVQLVDEKNSLTHKTIDYINQKTGKKFGYGKGNTKEIGVQISKLLKETNSFREIEDKFAHVIDVKCQEWLNNQEMKKHLNPVTLFRESNLLKVSVSAEYN